MDGSVKVGDFGLVTAITRPSRGKCKFIISFYFIKKILQLFFKVNYLISAEQDLVKI